MTFSGTILANSCACILRTYLLDRPLLTVGQAYRWRIRRERGETPEFPTPVSGQKFPQLGRTDVAAAADQSNASTLEPLPQPQGSGQGSRTRRLNQIASLLDHDQGGRVDVVLKTSAKT